MTPEISKTHGGTKGPNISCIPEGRYLLKTRIHPVKGKQIVVCHVPQRNGILIHAANDASLELQGCIAPVSKVIAPGKGLYSRVALERLEDLVIPVIDAREDVWLVVGLTPALSKGEGGESGKGESGKVIEKEPKIGEKVKDET